MYIYMYKHTNVNKYIFNYVKIFNSKFDFSINIHALPKLFDLKDTVKRNYEAE